ncbi:MAG TPA: hypothetical protein VIJ22_00580 [Polyangiaceae bacterium]
MAARKPRKYAFVPKLLMRTVIAGVIPACALAAADGCGGSTTSTSSKDGSTDGAPDTGFFGVAAVAYPAYESGVPETGSKDSSAKDSGTGFDAFGVAAVAYPAYEAGPG